MTSIIRCRLWAAVLLVVPWAAGCDVAGEQAGCVTPALAAQWAAEVIDLVNSERLSQGLDPLVANATLKGLSADYACQLILGGFFAHENPLTGSTVGSRAGDGGYDYLIVGENLAAGQHSPAEVVRAWMDSPGHRANILGEGYEEIGVAVRTGGEYGVYWVQEFGLPRP